MFRSLALSGAVLLAATGHAFAQSAAPEPATPAPGAYDAALAHSVGADEHGMRRYVLVILRSGPEPVQAGAQREEMFRGHFANMERLSREGKLVLAGPLGREGGARGMFVLAVPDIGQARELVATDPVVIQGEMVAEYHTYYGSAALMLIPGLHEKVAKKAL
jgi:uncharacterized protein YciI